MFELAGSMVKPEFENPCEPRWASGRKWQSEYGNGENPEASAETSRAPSNCGKRRRTKSVARVGGRLGDLRRSQRGGEEEEERPGFFIMSDQVLMVIVTSILLWVCGVEREGGVRRKKRKGVKWVVVGGHGAIGWRSNLNLLNKKPFKCRKLNLKETN